jgi:hypothetical protein
MRAADMILEDKDMAIAGDAGQGKALGLAPGALSSITIDCEGTGKNIKRLMDGNGDSVQDIAVALSVSPRLVYRWLTGDIGVRPEHAVRLSKVYGVPLERIYAVKYED